MTIIPFNPGRAGDAASTLRARRSDVRRCGPERGAGIRDAAEAEAAEPEAAKPDRVERLEHALIDLLRESATNWARAERAERAERMLGEQDPASPADRG